jgi:quercetin dioxygenase-like cupin family protein
MHETMKRFVHDRSRCQRPDIRAVVPRFPSARLVRTTLALLALTACSSPRATSPGSSTASRDITITRRDAQQTSVGPAETFTGTVRVQRLFLPTAPSRMQGAYVTFEPGAHTAWHTHPVGQILVVTAGTGYMQQWGGARQEIREGDVVWTPPNVKHWHGATPTSAMTHMALVEQLDGKSAAWMEKVTEAQYNGAP